MPFKNKEKRKEWYHTPIGRASSLMTAYKTADKKANRGECTLTTQWIVDNILFKPCAHCGKIGWDIIGCNRLNNDLPHTPDNVEPCCLKCNIKMSGIDLSVKVYQYTLEGELVKIWDSFADCNRMGYDASNVHKCCNGKIKHFKGYLWSYIPL